MGYGDEIMATAHARWLRERDQQRRRILFMDRNGAPRWSDMWQGNPNIAHPSERGLGWGKLLAARNGAGCRPYIARETLDRWTWRRMEWHAPGQIFLTDYERAQPVRLRRDARIEGPYAVIEPSLKKKATPNKQWPVDRWQQVVDMLPGVRWVQMAANPVPSLRGVHMFQTATFREACGVLAGAAAFIGHEGGLHHAAAALGVPAVVIFGGFISPEITGYKNHSNFYTGGAPCGNRQSCGHCRAAMEKITAAQIIDAAARTLGVRNAI